MRANSTKREEERARAERAERETEQSRESLYLYYTSAKKRPTRGGEQQISSRFAESARLEVGREGAFSMLLYSSLSKLSQ